MHHMKIEEDKRIIVCQAHSFPDGIMKAFQQLHARVPNAGQRTSYGISRPEGSMENIVYKAGIDEAFDGEGRSLGFDTYTIPAGNYHSAIIKDYMKNPAAIGLAFKELLAWPGLDPEGFCLEIYRSDEEVICAVPLNQ